MTSTTGNMIKAAKAFGTGSLISRKASRQRFAPITANLAPSMTISTTDSDPVSTAGSSRIQS